MPKVNYLTKKQLGVIEDLFAGELDEEQVLKKRRIRLSTYCRWHTMANFAGEYNRRLKQTNRKSELLIARFASIAASKLVELTQSEKEETARKACLDVINYFRQKARPDSEEQPETEKLPDLPPELASRLLAALANDEKHKSTNAQ
jgi:hypothetical protein